MNGRTAPSAVRVWNAAAALPAATVGAALSLVVAAHLALVGAGQWAGDEYYNFAQLRTLGWYYFRHRLIHWAPRPLSEMLLWGYSWIVCATGRPLIAEFLVLLWLALIGAALAHLWRAGRAHALPRLLLGTFILTMFLLGHTVAEVFYWPMGAAAYLPTLAGTTYVAIALVDGQVDSPRGRVAIAIALSVAAGSSEAGAMFVAALIPSLLLLDRIARPASPGRRSLPVPWVLAPLAISLAVIALAVFGRAGSNLALVPASPTLHHFWPSLRAAVAEGGSELFALSPGDYAPALLAGGAASRLLMLLGFRWCLRRGAFPPVPAAHLAALATAVLASGFVSLLASYDLFGFRCCLRHDTLRECGYVLVLLALAAIGLGRPGLGIRDRVAWIGPAAIFSAALLAFGPRGSELIAAYRIYPRTIAARDGTWKDAERRAPDLAFSDQPTLLTGQEIWPAGRFTRGPRTPWNIAAVIDFFRKKSVRIAPRLSGERGGWAR